MHDILYDILIARTAHKELDSYFERHLPNFKVEKIYNPKITPDQAFKKLPLGEKKKILKEKFFKDKNVIIFYITDVTKMFDANGIIKHDELNKDRIFKAYLFKIWQKHVAEDKTSEGFLEFLKTFNVDEMGFKQIPLPIKYSKQKFFFIEITG